MHSQTPRFDEWLAAEKDASKAERKLHGEMLKSATGGGAPNVELVVVARAKRDEAQRLFDEAMQEMKALAGSLRQH
jgi:hypothetical protein